MKGTSAIVAIVGVLLVVYAVIGRVVGDASVGFGIIVASSSSVLALANCILLLAIYMKLSSKE